MSVSVSARASSATRIAVGSSIGMSPCTLMTASCARSGSRRVIAAWMRSEPVGNPGSVSTARPPACSMISPIAGSPQATTTGPTPAATARRQTCTIIGTPARRASGLLGSRLAARRAGIRTIGLVIRWSANTAVRRPSKEKQAATTCPVRLLAGSAIIRLSWRPGIRFSAGRAARPARCPRGKRKGR